MSTAFDATVVPGGPAGTFHISADFINTSTQAMVNPFAEVVGLSGGNVLLNAEGGAGGVGARRRIADTSILAPGSTGTFDFLIGLQNREPFTFLVNVLGNATDLSVATTQIETLIDRSQPARDTWHHGAVEPF